MRFHKMQGAGNDYVYVDLAEETVANPTAVARLVSDRHFGVGADGLILIAPSSIADARMIMFNADGSEGAMCGNGVRSIAKYLFDRQRIGRKGLIETKAGVVAVEITGHESGVARVIRVNMGRPRLTAAETPTTLVGRASDGAIVEASLTACGREWRVTCVSMGNPHAVIFTDGVLAMELASVGAALEHHAVFPERANIEFVEVLDAGRLLQRTWERGAGETLACGSGACAVLVAASLTGRTGREAEIELRGGTLTIAWSDSNEVFMSGPAEYVFRGEVDLDRLAEVAADARPIEERNSKSQARLFQARLSQIQNSNHEKQ